jgi:hypothetical protein
MEPVEQPCILKDEESSSDAESDEPNYGVEHAESEDESEGPIPSFDLTA